MIVRFEPQRPGAATDYCGRLRPHMEACSRQSDEDAGVSRCPATADRGDRHRGNGAERLPPEIGSGGSGRPELDGRAQLLILFVFEIFNRVGGVFKRFVQLV